MFNKLNKVNSKITYLLIQCPLSIKDLIKYIWGEKDMICTANEGRNDLEDSLCVMNYQRCQHATHSKECWVVRQDA